MGLGRGNSFDLPKRRARISAMGSISSDDIESSSEIRVDEINLQIYSNLPPASATNRHNSSAADQQSTS
jgi:hypothetical protein